ncbi:MAG: antitoxin Xre-like helix-turn-helix domain-containing protein [Holophaga sp.]
MACRLVGPGDLERLSGPGVRAFFRIAERWGLAEADQQALLGGISRSTLHRWQRNQDALLTVDQLERVSCLLGIYRNLRILLPATADGWVSRPNTAPLFGGRTALEVMAEGGISALRQVRTYLDAQCWA